MSEFLMMGHHGLYVWGSVIVMAAAMVLEPVLLLRSRKDLLRRLKRQYRAAEASRQSAGRREESS